MPRKRGMVQASHTRLDGAAPSDFSIPREEILLLLVGSITSYLDDSDAGWMHDGGVPKKVVKINPLL